MQRKTKSKATRRRLISNYGYRCHTSTRYVPSSCPSCVPLRSCCSSQPVNQLAQHEISPVKSHQFLNNGHGAITNSCNRGRMGRRSWYVFTIVTPCYLLYAMLEVSFIRGHWCCRRPQLVRDCNNWHDRGTSQSCTSPTLAELSTSFH